MSPRKPLPSLPENSFAEIAVDLKAYADSAASAVAAGEIMAARGGWAGGMEHTLTELRAAAEISGQLYEFFRAAAPHEEAIRDLLAGFFEAAEAEKDGTTKKRGAVA